MPESLLRKISIVTPSFNQAKFLEDTILSILSQGYPNLEYIIIDGGSTDGSVDIIRKYADRLTYWVSGPDKGRGDAINKGFARSTGGIMAWLDCGNKYFPWTFEIVNQIFNDVHKLKCLASTTRLILNRSGMICHRDHIVSCESIFWRRSLWEKVGSVYSLKRAMLHTTTVPLVALRYTNNVDLILTDIPPSFRTFITKFLLSLPFVGYIPGCADKKVWYYAKIGRWHCIRPIGGKIINFITRSLQAVARLILG
jgi:glycosyltransferase involved in cell wall biosynthesis